MTFFHYLPNAISFRELTSGETERVLALCDEAIRKVNFIGWFVDGWGKIDPGQMGDDNRQTAERKDWSRGFGTKMSFFFPPKSEALGVLLESLSSLSTLEIIWTGRSCDPMRTPVQMWCRDMKFSVLWKHLSKIIILKAHLCSLYVYCFKRWFRHCPLTSMHPLRWHGC